MKIIKNKPLFEIYRDGKLVNAIYEKDKYGNEKNRRVIKTIYDIEGSRINEEISKGSICILRSKYNPKSPPRVETYLHPSDNVYTPDEYPSVYRNKETQQIISQDINPGDGYEHLFTYPSTKDLYGYGAYILPPNPEVGEIFYIENMIEYTNTSGLREDGTHWEMENWEHHSGASSIYHYGDIEARWNGEDLEFIAFPVLIIG